MHCCWLCVCAGKHAECESLLRRIQQAQGTAAELVYRLKVSHNLELNKYLQGMEPHTHRHASIHSAI